MFFRTESERKIIKNSCKFYLTTQKHILTLLLNNYLVYISSTKVRNKNYLSV